MFTKLFLFALIFYVPEQLHFPQSLGLPGINVYNVLFLIGLALALGIEKKSETPIPLKGRMYFYYGMGFFSLIIAMLTSSHFGYDASLFKQQISYSLLFFLFYRAAQDIQMVRFLLLGLAFTFLMLGLEIFKEAISYGFSGRRLSGAFGHDLANANYAGAYFAIMMPVLAAFMFFYKDNKLVRLAALGLFMLGVIAVFNTYSRQAYLAVAVATFLIAMRKSIGVAILVCIVLANYQLWAPESVVERVAGTTVESQEAGDDEEKLEESANSRFIIWSRAWEIIKANPFGVGYNQFQDVIDPYMPPEVIARDAHNQFILFCAEGGWLGALAFVLLLLGFFGQGRRLMRLGQETGNNEALLLGLGFAVSAIAVAMSNLTSTTFNSGEVMGNYWILAALVARYSALIEEGVDVRAGREQLDAEQEPYHSSDDALSGLQARSTHKAGL